MAVTERPNIVLITIDSLRADVVDSFCGGFKRTPFLNSLAEKSYVYTNAIVPSLPTYFVFPSIMSGTVPFERGNYLGIPPKTSTIAEFLKENGYKTYALIADNPALYEQFGYAKGFDYFFNRKQVRYQVGKKIGGQIINKLWELSLTEPFLSLQSLYRIINPPSLSIPAEELNKKAGNVLKTCNNTKPFFLWMHYMDVHDPYFSGIEFYKYKNLIKKYIFYHQIKKIGKQHKIQKNLVKKVIYEMYLSSIEYLDTFLQDFYKKTESMYPNTIFIITSDHGEAFMEHDFFGHIPVSLYNEVLKVPLLIKLPKEKSKTIDRTVSLISLAKTLVETLGLKNQFKGSNLLKNKTSTLDKYSLTLYKCVNPIINLSIFDNKTEIKYFEKLFSYYDKTWKYIYNEETNKSELYNLDKDPEEKKNIANQNNKKCKFYKNKIKKCLDT